MVMGREPRTTLHAILGPLDRQRGGTVASLGTEAVTVVDQLHERQRGSYLLADKQNQLWAALVAEPVTRPP